MDISIPQVFSHIHQQDLHLLWRPAKKFCERSDAKSLQSFIELRQIVSAYFFLPLVSYQRGHIFAIDVPAWDLLATFQEARSA